MEYWFKAFGMPNLFEKYKNIFLGKQDKPWNSKNTFTLYWSFL